MKTLILSAISVLFVAQATYAASAAECSQDLRVSASAYTNGKYLVDQQGGVPAIADCKNVQLPAEGVNYKVYLTADKSALVIRNENTRAITYSVIPGFITDYAVMAGRLIISTADKKVLVVGRNGNIFEMLTSAGKSYADVKSIAIRNNLLVMEQFQNQPIQLDVDQVTRRVNEPGKFRAISF